MNLLRALIIKLAPSGSRANREAHAAHEATLGRDARASLRSTSSSRTAHEGLRDQNPG